MQKLNTTDVSLLSRRRILASIGSAAALRSVSSGAAAKMIAPPLPPRVRDVNTTSIRAAVGLATHTMSNVFNADDHDIPFFGSTVWPAAGLSFQESHTESHVPGRHLNALLSAEDALGIRVPEWVIEKHARAALFAYSGPLPLPLNRERIGGPLVRFLPHNLREGFHALYALVRYRKSEEARRMAERSIDAVLRYWNPVRGWDRAYIEGTLGLKLVEWPSPFMTGVARAMGPLVKYYRATGYGPALKLALLLADKARDEFFSDGMYSSERFGTHVHSTTCVMSSLAQIADLLHDGPLMSLVHVFFNNGLTQISDSLGWSIENSDPSSVPDRGEANNTGDILETSLLLGAHGYHDCYGRAEQILRGHLLPCQLRDISFIQTPENSKHEDGKRDVAARHLGAFGFPAPYGHLPLGAKDISFNMDIVGGVTGSLCEAWQHIVSLQDACRVNMLFDHETDAVAVTSPYTHDSLSIHLKKQVPLFLRIPDWADRRALSVEGIDEPPRFEGSYLFVTRPIAGSAIRVRFKLPSREIVLPHRAHGIHVRLRGDRVEMMENFGAPLAYFDPLA